MNNRKTTNINLGIGSNFKKFYLQEALLDLEEQITGNYPAIHSLKLKISKPDILKNCTVGLSRNWEISPSL